MNIIEKHNKQFEYAAIVMNLIIAYQFLNVWIYPDASDVSKISSMAGLMAFEFIMVHSGVFMAVMPRKLSLFVFVPFYGLFAWTFSSSMGNTNILIIYLVVVVNRMRFAFSDVSTQIKNRAIGMSAVAAMTYFVLIFVVLFTNGIFGELGLTQKFLESTTYFDNIKRGGQFLDKPHTAISFGFFYYCALALWEALLINKKVSDKPLIRYKKKRK